MLCDGKHKQQFKQQFKYPRLLEIKGSARKARHACLHMMLSWFTDTAKPTLCSICTSFCECCWCFMDSLLLRVEWSPLLELYELTAEVKDENGDTLMKGLSAKVRLHLAACICIDRIQICTGEIPEAMQMCRSVRFNSPLQS